MTVSTKPLQRAKPLASLLCALLISVGCGGGGATHGIDEDDAAGSEAGILLAPLKEAHQWIYAVPAENAGRMVRIAAPKGPQWEVQRSEHGELLSLKGALPTEAQGPVAVSLRLTTGTPSARTVEAEVDRDGYFAGMAGRHQRFSEVNVDGLLQRTAVWQSETDGGHLYFSATAHFPSGRDAASSAAWDELLYSFRAVAKSLEQSPTSVFGSVGHSELINFFSIPPENRAKLTFPGVGDANPEEVVLSVPAEWEVFSEAGDHIELSLSLTNQRIVVLGMKVNEASAPADEFIAGRYASIGRGEEQNARILERGETFVGSLPGLSYRLVDTRTVGQFPARHMTKRWVTTGAGLEIEISASVFGHYQDMGITDDYDAFLPLFQAIVNTLEISPQQAETD